MHLHTHFILIFNIVLTSLKLTFAIGIHVRVPGGLYDRGPLSIPPRRVYSNSSERRMPHGYGKTGGPHSGVCGDSATLPESGVGAGL